MLSSFRSLSSMKLANTTTEMGAFSLNLPSFLHNFLAHSGSFARASLYYMSPTVRDSFPLLRTFNVVVAVLFKNWEQMQQYYSNVVHNTFVKSSAELELR